MRRLVFPLALVVFCASGFAALLYQVIWQRLLTIFSGADVFSATIIVAAFMGGLGVGTLVGRPCGRPGVAACESPPRRRRRDRGGRVRLLQHLAVPRRAVRAPWRAGSRTRDDRRRPVCQSLVAHVLHGRLAAAARRGRWPIGSIAPHRPSGRSTASTRSGPPRERSSPRGCCCRPTGWKAVSAIGAALNMACALVVLPCGLADEGGRARVGSGRWTPLQSDRAGRSRNRRRRRPLLGGDLRVSAASWRSRTRSSGSGCSAWS